jgi:hypothetical protein
MRNTIFFDRSKTDESEIIELLNGYESVSGAYYNAHISVPTVHFVCDSEEALNEIEQSELVETLLREIEMVAETYSTKISFPTKNLLVDGGEVYAGTKNPSNFPSRATLEESSGTDFLSIGHLIQTEIGTEDTRPIGISETWLHGPDVATATKEFTYESNYNGEDVDVLVYEVPGSSDADLAPFPWDHPNWLNSKGESRVKKVNWLEYNPNIRLGPRRTNPSTAETTYLYALNQIDNPDAPNSYEHALGSISAAAGRYTGFAKESNIYWITASLQIFADLENIYDAIINWHNSKPVNPRTGRKNPTVLTESWGFSSLGGVTRFRPHEIVNVESVSSVKFGNETVTRPAGGWGNDFSALVNAGVLISKIASSSSDANVQAFRPFNWGIKTYPSSSSLAVSITTLDLMRKEIKDAGIYSFMSAGNDGAVICKNGEADKYEITVDDGASVITTTGGLFRTTDGEETFRLARDWPLNNSPDVYTVAAASPNTSSGIRDLDAYTNRGPGIDIVALGEGAFVAGEQYQMENSFKDRDGWFWSTGFNGTSAASPNAAGIAAVLLDYLWDRGETQPSFEDLKQFMQNQSAEYLSSSYRSRDWSNVSLDESPTAFPPGLLAPDRYIPGAAVNYYPEAIGLRRLSDTQFLISNRALPAQETAGTFPGLLSLSDTVRLYKSVPTNSNGEIVIIEEDEEDPLVNNTSRKVDPLVEPEDQRFYFGLSTTNSLSDVRDSKEALRNIGLFYDDLNVIRGIRDLGLNRDDLHTIALLNFDAVRTLTSINSSIDSTLEGISADVERIFIDYKMAADTKVTAKAFKYKYYDHVSRSHKFADISSSRTSSWSTFVGDEANPPIYYGGNLEVTKDPSTSSSKVNLTSLTTESAPIPKRYAAEVPTHIVTLNIDGTDRNFYAMKGIPLTFKGFFRNIAPNQIGHKVLQDNEDDPKPTWTLKALDEVGSFFEFEDVDIDTFIRYFDYRTREREVKFYYNPDKIEELFVKNIKFRDFPKVTMTGLLKLEIDRNDIITTPNLEFYTSNLIHLDISNQNLMRAKDYIFANDQFKLLPSTLEFLNVDGCYSSPNFIQNGVPKTIDFSHMTNLKELYFNANSELKMGVFDGTPIVYEDYSDNPVISVEDAEPGITYEVVSPGNTDFSDADFIKNSEIENVGLGMQESFVETNVPAIPPTALYDEDLLSTLEGYVAADEKGSFQFGKIIKQSNNYVAVLARVHASPGDYNSNTVSLYERRTNRSEIWVYDKSDFNDGPNLAPKFKWRPNYSADVDFLGDTYAYEILDTFIQDIDITDDALVASVMTKVALKPEFEDYIINHHPNGVLVQENEQEETFYATIKRPDEFWYKNTPTLTLTGNPPGPSGIPRIVGAFGAPRVKEGETLQVGVLTANIPAGETLTWSLQHSQYAGQGDFLLTEYEAWSGTAEVGTSFFLDDERVTVIDIEVLDDGIGEPIEYGGLRISYVDEYGNRSMAFHTFEVYDASSDMPEFTVDEIDSAPIGTWIPYGTTISEQASEVEVYGYWVNTPAETPISFDIKHITTNSEDFASITEGEVQANWSINATLNGLQWIIRKSLSTFVPVDDGGSLSSVANEKRKARYGGLGNYPFSNVIHIPNDIRSDTDETPGVGFSDFATPNKPVYYEGAVLVLEDLQRGDVVESWTGEPITADEVYQDFVDALSSKSEYGNYTAFLDQIRNYTYEPVEGGGIKKFKTPTAFGAAVGLSNNNVYVGAPELRFLFSPDNQGGQGAISVFDRINRNRLATFGGDPDSAGNFKPFTFEINAIIRGYASGNLVSRFSESRISDIRKAYFDTTRDAIGYYPGGWESYFYNGMPMQDYRYGSIIRVTSDDKFFTNGVRGGTYLPGADQVIIKLDLNAINLSLDGLAKGAIGNHIDGIDSTNTKQALLDAKFLSGFYNAKPVVYDPQFGSPGVDDLGTIIFSNTIYEDKTLVDADPNADDDNDLDYINRIGWNTIGEFAETKTRENTSSDNYLGFGKCGFDLGLDLDPASSSYGSATLIVGHSMKGTMHLYTVNDRFSPYRFDYDLPRETIVGPDRLSFVGSVTSKPQVMAYQRRFGWNPSINPVWISTIYTDPNLNVESKNINDTYLLKMLVPKGENQFSNIFKVTDPSTTDSTNFSKSQFYVYDNHDPSYRDKPILFSETEGAFLLDNFYDLSMSYASAVHLKSVVGENENLADVDSGTFFVTKTTYGYKTQFVDLDTGDVFVARGPGSGSGTIKRVVNSNDFEVLEFTGHSKLDVVDELRTSIPLNERQRVMHSSVERSGNLKHLDISRCDIISSTNGPAGGDIKIESDTISSITSELNKHAFIDISNRRTLRSYEQSNKVGFTRRVGIPNRYNNYFAHDISENNYLSNVNSLETLIVNNVAVWGNLANVFQSLTSMRDLRFVNCMMYGNFSAETFSGTTGIENLTLSGPILGHRRGLHFSTSDSSGIDLKNFRVNEPDATVYYTNEEKYLRYDNNDDWLYDRYQDFFDEETFMGLPRLKIIRVYSTTSINNVFGWIQKAQRNWTPSELAEGLNVPPIDATDTSGIRGSFPNFTKNLELAVVEINYTQMSHGLTDMRENKALEVLNVSNNRLQQRVPIYNSDTLRVLNLSNNFFESDLLNPFPVFECPNLLNLNLSQNPNLKGGVPDLRKCFKLIEIDLSYTGFSEYVPGTFAGLTDLQYLGFAAPRIPKSHAQQIIYDMYKSYLKNPRTGVSINFDSSEWTLGSDSDPQELKDIMRFLIQQAKWVIISGSTAI